MSESRRRAKLPAILLLAILILSACGGGGVVRSGTLTLLQDDRVCIEEPEAGETCWERERGAEVPAGLEEGGLVTVRVEGGVVTSIEVARAP